MIPLLDKKVIQFTREGLVRKNLSTGESEVVVQSDYAKEIKYQPAGKEARYRSPYEHPDGKIPGDSSPKIETKVQRPGSGEQRSGADEWDNTAPGAAKPGGTPLSDRRGAHPHVHNWEDVGDSRMDRTQGRPPQSRGTPPPGRGGRGPARYSYGKRQNNVKYYYTPRTDSGYIPTPAEYRKNIRGRFSIGKQLSRFSKDRIFRNDEENDDNAGIQAVGTTIRSSRRLHSGIRRIRELNQKRKYIFQSVERTAVYQRPAAARTASTVAGNTAFKAGNVVRKAAGLLKNPATVKFLLLAAAIFIGVLLLCMLFGGLVGSLFGSTNPAEHPELTAYVQQLDDEFISKITDLKKSYEGDSHTEVKIQGSDVVNTDPNVLAILATGNWTDIDLTDENKAKLKNCYDILNTYKVTKKDKKVKKISETGEKSTYTEHHITIMIITSAAKNKIDNFGFTDAQKSNVLNMLEMLEQIEGINTVPDIPNPGTGSAPGEAYGDPQVQMLFSEANQYLGYPYVWGGSNPETSFDCSGFVCWVFTHSGVQNLPRTSAQGLFDQCTPISQSEAKPGDLVFFTKTYPTSNMVTHVGIYAGNDRMIHCGDPIQYTTLDKTYWQEHLYSFGRLK